MATFVFLHGSFHAAWNWHKTVGYVARRGHRTVALDLLGHGLDTTPPRRVTLASCVEQVLDVVSRQDDPVVLVAHSRNGIVISQAAEQQPDRISGLVYLAAFLVPNGRSVADYAVHDVDSLVAQNLEVGFQRQPIRLRHSQIGPLARICRTPLAREVLRRILPRDLQTHRLRPEAYRDALYHDCPDDITELANVLLQPEPHWAGFTPLRLTPERYGRVPKVYIECLQDRAISLRIQRRMLSDTPCDRVYSLDASHSPFFSQPDKLAATLIDSLSAFSLQ